MKLTYFLSILAMILLLVSVILYSNTKEINVLSDEINKFSEQTLPTIKTLENIKVAGLRIVSSTSEFGFILAESDEGASEEEALIEEGKKEYDATLKRYSTLVSLYFPDEKIFVEQITEKGNELKKGSDAIIDMKKRGISGKDVLEAKEAFEDAEQSFLAAIDTALAYETKELEERKEKLASSVSKAKRTTFSLLLLSICTIIIIGFLFYHKIISPLKKIAQTSNKISEGNLDSRVNITSKNEIGDLAKAFNNMVDKVSFSQHKLIEQSKNLERDVKRRTQQLQKEKDDAEKLSSVAIGRELRMIELKKKIKELEKQNKK